MSFHPVRLRSYLLTFHISGGMGRQLEYQQDADRDISFLVENFRTIFWIAHPSAGFAAQTQDILLCQKEGESRHCWRLREVTVCTRIQFAIVQFTAESEMNWATPIWQ